MPEPLVPSMLMGGALFGLVFSCEIGPELTCGVGVAAGVEGVSRGPPAPPDAASASASPMEPGPSAGVEAGFEKGLRDPAPGSVERRGGGGRRDSGGGNPGRPGRAVVGALDIRLDDNGAALDRDGFELRLGEPVQAVATGPRVGLRGAPERPWRFWIEGDPSVSVYRPAKGLRPRFGAPDTPV